MVAGRIRAAVAVEVAVVYIVAVVGVAADIAVVVVAVAVAGAVDNLLVASFLSSSYNFFSFSRRVSLSFVLARETNKAILKLLNK